MSGPLPLQSDSHTQMRCAFGAPGTFDARLYVNDAQAGKYDYAAQVQVNVQ